MIRQVCTHLGWVAPNRIRLRPDGILDWLWHPDGVRCPRLEFRVHGYQWDEMIANSKFADPCAFRHFAKVRKGRIGLQDHGDKVSFRNIKIKEL